MISQNKYFLDTVVVTRLADDIFKNEAFEKNCILIEEILYELGDYGESHGLKELKCAPKVTTLDCIKDIFVGASIDSNVLDLYKNKGNGDILLLAAALNEKRKNGMQLFDTTRYIIVTEDKALVYAASELKIETMNTQEFCDSIKNT